ncbi:MAG: GNAT family N-acetyltransferase [Stappiaceae bacterium]
MPELESLPPRAKLAQSVRLFWSKIVSIGIRHVQIEDVEALHRIFPSNRTMLGTMRLPYQALDYTKKRLAPEDGVIKLVALMADEIAGFCELITYSDAHRHCHVGEFNMIATNEKWRGRGAGAALMDAMIDLSDNWLQLRRLNLIVWTPNIAAIALYKKIRLHHRRHDARLHFRRRYVCRYP